MGNQIRSIKFKFTPTPLLKKQLVLMFWAAKELVNELMRHARYLNKYRGKACQILRIQGACCHLKTYDNEEKKWIEVKRDKNKLDKGVEVALVPESIPGKSRRKPARLLIQQFGETANIYWDKGLAWEILQSLYSRKASAYPRQKEEEKITKGKKKGQTRLIDKVSSLKADYTFEFQYDGQKSRVGLSGKTVGAIARIIDGNFQSFLSHIRKGNYKAKPPYKQKSYVPLSFNKKEIKWENNSLRLGCSSKSKRERGINIHIPALRKYKNRKFQDATITRSLNGEYWLHLSYEIEIKENNLLSNSAAVDFGQKRAIVIANSQGQTATISGKNICAIKRIRDRRYREINRKRARIIRGQIRQYLTPEEKAKYRELQLEDNQRQKEGKKRTGADIKYARARIKHHRDQGTDGKGRSLVALNQKLPDRDFHKRSNSQYKLLKTTRKIAQRYRRSLDYANHCVARAAVDWAVLHGCGTIYIGDLDNIPKGRTQGKRRIKQVARNNLWEWPKQAKYLEDKLIVAGGTEVIKASERFTSQICPNCGKHNKPRNRIYSCSTKKGGCGYIGDRDAIGAVNFLNKCLERVAGSSDYIKPSQNQILHISPAFRGGKKLFVHNPKNKFIYLRSTQKHRLTENPRMIQKCEKSPKGAGQHIKMPSGFADCVKTKDTLCEESTHYAIDTVPEPQTRMTQRSADSADNPAATLIANRNVGNDRPTPNQSGNTPTKSSCDRNCAPQRVLKSYPKKNDFQTLTIPGLDRDLRSIDSRACPKNTLNNDFQAKVVSKNQVKYNLKSKKSSCSAQSTSQSQLELNFDNTAGETTS